MTDIFFLFSITSKSVHAPERLNTKVEEVKVELKLKKFKGINQVIIG